MFPEDHEDVPPGYPTVVVYERDPVGPGVTLWRLSGVMGEGPDFAAMEWPIRAHLAALFRRTLAELDEVEVAEQAARARAAAVRLGQAAGQ